MKMTIEINCDGDAFQDGNLVSECLSIINKNIVYLKHGVPDTLLLFDVNGNVVGEANITDD